MKIGILTGGGDCPGLNAVIRAAVRKGTFHYEDQFIGFLEGWRGLMENKTMPLDLQAVAGILRAIDRAGVSNYRQRVDASQIVGPLIPSGQAPQALPSGACRALGFGGWRGVLRHFARDDLCRQVSLRSISVCLFEQKSE